MQAATLDGKHTYPLENGKQVSIVQRDGTYLVRGRYQGRQFGETLGTNEAQASIRLRQILAALDNGTYQRPTEVRQTVVAPLVLLQLSYRDLADRFLTGLKARKGESSMKTFRSRLTHFLEFVEQESIRKLAPIPCRVSSTLAQKFVDYLRTVQVTRNGKPGAKKRPMSRKQQQNCYDAVRTMFEWGRKPAQGLLPASLTNPFTPDLLGPIPQKDPLRSNPLPLQTRTALVEQMDPWQLLNLSFQLVLPLRPDELCAALVGDLDPNNSCWKIGAQLPHWYATKGGTCFQLPLPPILTEFGRILKGQGEGPLFRRRASRRHSAQTLPTAESGTFPERLARHLSTKVEGRSLAAQDRKELYQKELIALGGLTPKHLRDHWKGLFQQIGLASTIRAYDLRGAVTTEMAGCGMRQLELRYLTSHSTNDILNEYVTLTPQEEMQKYYERIHPLLAAIERRATEVGLVPATDRTAQPSSMNASSLTPQQGHHEQVRSCRDADRNVEFRRCG